MTINLTEIQHQQKAWAAYNFPKSTEAWVPILGMQEELGELSHAYLKSFQNIRGTKAEHEAEMQDAVGDILIYLMDFCNKTEIDMEAAIHETWALVKKRDWQKFPKNGMSE